ncbi:MULTISPECIES: hypothetical protein [unclassified Cryobacterium]|nr:MULTISPECIES: hypothetical protein [unclassified Cryobacterium]
MDSAILKDTVAQPNTVTHFAPRIRRVGWEVTSCRRDRDGAGDCW